MSKKESTLKVDSIETNRLVIKTKKGKTLATLAEASDGAGLWLEGPTGDTVAIYAIEGQTAIGIYAGEESKSDGKGIDLALFVSDGEPCVQFRRDGGDAKIVKLADVVAHAECCECDPKCCSEAMA